MGETVLDVRNLAVEFVGENQYQSTVAVQNLSFRLEKGQILGIVGESGSGKSITSLAIMGLIPTPGKISEGEIWFPFEEAEVENLQLSSLQRERHYQTGKINLLGLAETQKQQYRGGQIAMIFQEPMSSFNPVYTIGKQLTEAILQHYNRAFQVDLADIKNISPQIKRKNAQGRAIQLLQQVQLPDPQEKLDRYPHELSGGQLQRVMIAMAISCNPTLLIADEPTTALDVTVQAGILDLLRDLCRKRQMSMIFITHDFGVIANIADAVVVMRKGQKVENGNIRQLLQHPEKPYTKGLLACRPQLDQSNDRLPTVYEYLRDYIAQLVAEFPLTATKVNEQKRQALEKEVADLSSEEQEKLRQEEPELWQRLHKILGKDELFDTTPTSLSVLSDTSQKHINNLPETQEDLLGVERLSVRFQKKGFLGTNTEDFIAVNNVSFTVKQGETLGLVGESGCGKSTLARAILRLLPNATGQVRFEGKDITHFSGSKLQKLRQQMQIIFQNPYSSLNPRMTIGTAIMEPMIIHNAFGNERQAKVSELLENVGINPRWKTRYPHQLSGGQRQRVCIARALALKPKLIICDESVSALDVSVQAQVLNLLKDLQDQYKLTYIFISHDLSVVEFMSDRILVMNKGQIEESGEAKIILHQPQQAYTKQLIRSIPTGELTINLGGIPLRTRENSEEIYEKLAQYLQEKLEIRVNYKPIYSQRDNGKIIDDNRLTYRETLRAFQGGNLDIVFLGELTKILASQLVADARILVQSDQQSQSIFLANNSLNIKQFESITEENLLSLLRGRKFLFCDELSTSGYLVPRYLLQTYLQTTAENIDFKFQDVDCFGSHQRTINLIKNGEYDAGVVNKSIWEKIITNSPDILEKVQPIWETPSYINRSYCLLYPHLERRLEDNHLGQKIQAALLSLDSNIPDQKAILDFFGASEFQQPQAEATIFLGKNFTFEEIESYLMQLENYDSYKVNNLTLLNPLEPRFLETIASSLIVNG